MQCVSDDDAGDGGDSANESLSSTGMTQTLNPSWSSLDR